jgi:ribokinase
VDFDVVVVGSLNRDISIVAPRLPKAGESITGTDHFFGPGGKGANQAVAVARLGGRVAMVGRVGDDEHGAVLVAGLESEGVDISAVTVDEVAGTGLAVITIDEDAENTIVVSPAANSRLAPFDIERSGALVASATVVLTQLEVPFATVEAASEIATGVFCINPAPARHLPTRLMRRVDLLVPNRSELGVLARSTEPTDVQQAVEMAASLEHPGATVVTLGSDGAVLVEDGRAIHVPSPEVVSVDPTGAGDAFCGALAYSLSRGRTLEQAVRTAAAAGALATTRRGAQTAMPTSDEVEAFLNG